MTRPARDGSPYSFRNSLIHLVSRLVAGLMGFAVVAILTSVFSSLAQAQSPSQGEGQSSVSERHQPKGAGVKRTTIDFEDQLVEGEVKKPELFYLLQKKQFNFGKLIKLRENFVPEMTRNAEDVGKGP